MRFGKCMGVLGGHLYKVWEVYGGPKGVIYMRFEKCIRVMGVAYMRFGKCMGVLGGHRVSFL